MYPAELVAPMKEDLTSRGYKELITESDVDQVLNQDGTTFVVINSVCGCAAANARPAAIIAASNSILPDNLVTVFAGVDREAVEQVRKYCLPYPPSSPSMALFKDGVLVHFIERHHIEGRPADMIAENIVAAFNEYCN
ncbi:MAG: BrxA/BrxB family bacilliredoxin [Flavobacteriales bacterium]|nr:BrxA/BrxB family bacilliredoxin [Flavobacteriales bacterium]